MNYIGVEVAIEAKFVLALVKVQGSGWDEQG